LRNEPNFGLSPFFLVLYKLILRTVEGVVGSCFVANKEAEVLRDGKFVGLERVAEEGNALEAKRAQAEPPAYRDLFDKVCAAG